MTVTIKNLAGDLISVACLPTTSLLDLKQKITVAAASQLGADWPAAQQKLMSMSSDDSNDDEKSWTKESMSLQVLGIGDGDVLAVLIEEPDQVRWSRYD